MKPESNFKGRILIVDDRPENLAVLFDCLHDAGFKVFLAPDGQSALAQAHDDLPDLILLDIKMPGADGFETCRALKENMATREIPVIFMTALSDTIYKVKGFKSGAVDYITKPFQQEEVVARVTTHITLLKQKQDLLRQKEILFQTNTEKEVFISIISHDLKNQFASMLGYSEIIKSPGLKLSPAEKENAVDHLIDGVERTYALLIELLSWANARRDKVEYHPTQLYLADLIRNDFELLAESARQKRIKLINEIPDAARARGDVTMIDTVLRNLINNAIKFTPTDGKIVASAVQKESFMEIAITDTGIGIKKADQKRLFRMDEKYQNPGTAGETGTGLGLLLCKELIEKNGGQLIVKSEIGKGSTFAFTLPI